MNMENLKSIAVLAQELSNVIIESLNGTLDTVCEGSTTRTVLTISVLANVIATASVQLIEYQETPDDILRLIHKSAQDRLNQREKTS